MNASYISLPLFLSPLYLSSPVSLYIYPYLSLSPPLSPSPYRFLSSLPLSLLLSMHLSPLSLLYVSLSLCFSLFLSYLIISLCISLPSPPLSLCRSHSLSRVSSLSPLSPLFSPPLPSPLLSSPLLFSSLLFSSLLFSSLLFSSLLFSLSISLSLYIYISPIILCQKCHSDRPYNPQVASGCPLNDRHLAPRDG